MKLAEALLLRSDLQKKLASLRERIGMNSVVQDGEQPHEDPQKLITESFGVMQQLEQIVFGINQANLEHSLRDGRTITAAISRRDTLIAQHSLLQHAISNSHKEPDRYSRSEIKWKATLDIAKLQKQSDDLAKKIRELNSAIQETNWKVEIKESTT